MPADKTKKSVNENFVGESQYTGRGMQHSSNDNRLRALEDRAAKIKAQIAAIEARQASRNRKDETRTKVLVGAAILADSALHEETRNGMRTVLARAITAPRDRDFLRSRGLID